MNGLDCPKRLHPDKCFDSHAQKGMLQYHRNRPRMSTMTHTRRHVISLTLLRRRHNTLGHTRMHRVGLKSLVQSGEERRSALMDSSQQLTLHAHVKFSILRRSTSRSFHLASTYLRLLRPHRLYVVVTRSDGAEPVKLEKEQA